MAEIKRNCNTCMHGLFAKCDALKGNEDYQKIKDTFADGWVKKREFKESFICDLYECLYIEYPLTIAGIEYDTKLGGYKNKDVGKFAQIRPCGEEYEGKTFLGLFLGDLPIDIHISHSKKTDILNAGFETNPAIFVFDIGKIIYGVESWWSIIENESDLKGISDIDIENVWYVKALKSLAGDV